MHVSTLLLSEKEQVVLDAEDISFLPQSLLKDIHRVFQEVQRMGNHASSAERRQKKLKLLLTLLLSKTWQIKCEVLSGLSELCVLPFGRIIQDIIVSTPIVPTLNGLQVISSLLSICCPRVQAAAARLIGCLCVHNENIRCMIGNFGLIPMLTQLLLSSHEDVKKHSAAAICCVVDDNARNKGAVQQEDGISALYSMICLANSSSSSSSTEEAAMAAVSCIGALVTGYPPAQNTLRNLGILSTLVSMLYTQSSRMVARITCLLAEAARDNSFNSKAIVAEGGFQAVSHILSSSHTTSPSEPIFHALKLLWCLCKDSSKRCRCVRSMTSSLMPLLGELAYASSSQQIRAAAALALRTLERT